MTQEAYENIVALKTTPDATITSVFQEALTVLKIIKKHLRGGKTFYIGDGKGNFTRVDFSEIDSVYQRRSLFEVIDGNKQD